MTRVSQDWPSVALDDLLVDTSMEHPPEPPAKWEVLKQDVTADARPAGEMISLSCAMVLAQVPGELTVTLDTSSDRWYGLGGSEHTFKIS